MPTPPQLPIETVFAQIGAAIHRVQQEVAGISAALVTAFNSLPGELRPAMRLLANLGWFPSGEMGLSEIHAFRALCGAGNTSAVDDAMIDWMERELQSIEERASLCFPKRRRIIASAFNAHRSEQYDLSIPVLMAQAEGMCLEVVGTKLFSTNKGVPATRSATDRFSHFALSDALLLPFREPTGFTASESTRHNWPDAPNRHEILHGIAVDYGTRKNSFKTVYLLEYFVTFVVPKFQPNWPY